MKNDKISDKTPIEPPTGLKKGLEIIEPFLKGYDFAFHNYENFESSGSQFTFAKYKNEHKQFILGYHFSVGQVVYQFDDSQLSHDFYLHQLGFANHQRFQDIQTTDKLLPFIH